MLSRKTNRVGWPAERPIYCQQIGLRVPLFSSILMARLPLPPDQRLVCNVNIALTQAQYQYFKELAGHTPPTRRVDSRKPMPTRQRNIASIIRERIANPQQEPATFTGKERQALMGIADELRQLTITANIQGYAVVANQIDQLVTQLQKLLSLPNH